MGAAEVVERYVDYNFVNTDGELEIDMDYKRRLLRKKQKQTLINAMHAMSLEKRRQDDDEKQSENERQHDENDDDDDVMMDYSRNRNQRMRQMFG
eukprot:345515_1